MPTRSPREIRGWVAPAHRSLALAKREISRNDPESAETFLLDALGRMPALPNACMDLVRVQVSLDKLEDARDTAKDCHRMLLDNRRRQILRELLEHPLASRQL